MSGLYLVGLPIGNARDITLRALDVLAAVDVVACEDTRVTAPLLHRYGITTRLTSYHEHNADRARPALLRRIAAGEAVALVSDAGMPLISDPGYKLVQAVLAAGGEVTCVPGPSAPLAALSLSGLPSDRFLFAGFLPPKAGARRRALEELAAAPATLILFETAPRLAACLADAAAVLGDRPAAVARELTKRFEEVRRGRLGELAEAYGRDGPPKGEIVVVIGPPEPAPTAEEDADRIDDALRSAMADLGLRDAVDAVAAATGHPRRAIYRRALALAAGAGDGDDQ